MIENNQMQGIRKLDEEKLKNLSGGIIVDVFNVDDMDKYSVFQIRKR